MTFTRYFFIVNYLALISCEHKSTGSLSSSQATEVEITKSIPEQKPLSEWYEVPFEEVKSVIETDESEPFETTHLDYYLWEVLQKDDKVIARTTGDYSNLQWPEKKMDFSDKLDFYKKPHRLLRVNDGWLAGYNAGEFGAELWWFSQDGSDSYKISEHQLNQFLETENGIFAAEGISHMSISEGSVIRLFQKEGKWRAVTHAKFETCEPSGIVSEEDGSITVIGGFGYGCWSISPEGQLTPLKKLSKVPVPDFYSTAAREGKKIYLGSQYFVMEIDLETMKRRYLLPTEEHWKK